MCTVFRNCRTPAGTSRRNGGASAGLADHLPAAPGVYLFRGPSDEVLYVGTSGQSAPAGPVLFLCRRDPRPDQAHGGAGRTSRPRGMRACAGGAHPRAAVDRRPSAAVQPAVTADRERSRWVTLTDEAFPRLSIVRTMPRTGRRGLPRPVQSRQAAQTAVEALQDAVPIRRCTAPDPARSIRTAALAPWPNSADAGRHAPARRTSCRTPDMSHRIRQLIDGDSDEILTVLRDRLTTLSRSGRFDQAALTRDRLSAPGSGSRPAAATGGVGRHRRDGRGPTRRLRRVGPDGHPIRPLRCRRPGTPRCRSRCRWSSCWWRLPKRFSRGPARCPGRRPRRRQRCCGGSNVRARGWCGRRLPGSARPPVPDDGARS